MSGLFGGLFGSPSSSHQDRGPAMKTFSIFMIVIPTIVILLRIWSAVLIRTRPDFPLFWWDDWLAFFTLGFSITTNALIIWWCSLGLGKHEADVPITELQEGLKCLFILLYFACFAIQLPKLSCLFFYARVFTTKSKPFRIALWSIGATIIGWLISSIITITFQCTPVAKVWRGPFLKGHCINQSLFILFSEGITNVILDTAILILPMPLLWSLKTSRARILRLTCVFVCGYAILLISIGKTVTIGKTYPKLDIDPTWNAIDIFYWTTAEAPFSIVSISVPALYALGLRAVQHGPRSLLSSKYSKTPKNSQSSGVGSRPPRAEEASFRHRRNKPSARNVADDSLLASTVGVGGLENDEDIELGEYRVLQRDATLDVHSEESEPEPEPGSRFSMPTVPGVGRERNALAAHFVPSSIYTPIPRIYRPSSGWQ